MTKLQRILKEQGLTVSTLARELRLGRAYVSHLVHGRRRNPSPKIALKLATRLKMKPQDLFTSYGR